MFLFGIFSLVVLIVMFLVKKDIRPVFYTFLLLVLSYFLFVYLISLPVVFKSISILQYFNYVVVFATTLLMFVAVKSIRKTQMVDDMTQVISSLFAYQIQKLFLLFFLILLIPFQYLSIGLVFVYLISILIKADNYKIGLTLIVGLITNSFFQSYVLITSLVETPIFNSHILMTSSFTIISLVILMAIDRFTMPKRNDGSLKVPIKKSIIFLVAQCSIFIVTLFMISIYFNPSEALIVAGITTIIVNSTSSYKLFDPKVQKKQIQSMSSKPRLLSVVLFLIIFATYITLIKQSLIIMLIVFIIEYMAIYKIYHSQIKVSFRKNLLPTLTLGLIVITAIIFSEFIRSSAINNLNYGITLNDVMKDSFLSSLDTINLFKNILGYSLFINPQLIVDIMKSSMILTNKVILVKSLSLFLVINPFSLYAIKVIFDIKNEFMYELIILACAYVVAAIALILALTIFI